MPRLFLLTALAMLAFAANSVLNRLAVGQGLIGPVEFAVMRVAAGAIALAIIATPWRRRTTDPLSARVMGVGGLVVYLFGFSLAYLELDAGTGALALFGTVQVTMFCGAFLSREAIPARRWWGAALALGGLSVLAAPGTAPLPAVPLGLMVLAGVGWGLYSLAGRLTVDPLGSTARNFLIAAPLAGLVAALSGIAWPAWHGAALACLSGALTSGLGYALWYAILPQLGAARAAVAQLSVPVLAAAGGAILLAEVPDWRFALAALMVLGGVALAIRQSGLTSR